MSFDIFLQGEGIDSIKRVNVSSETNVQELVSKAIENGFQVSDSESPIVLLEDSDDELVLSASLKEAGITNRCHVHIHRCRQVEVSVNFNGEQITRKIRPAATIQRLHRWAARKFQLDETQSSKHLLQICGSNQRPDEEIHVGTLVKKPECGVCFDLVPKQRVEG